MTDQATLAAYACEYLPELWSGHHQAEPLDGENMTCVHCRATSMAYEFAGFDVPCPGPDLTQDADVLLRMAFALGVTVPVWKRMVEVGWSKDIVKTFQSHLLAAVLAGIAALEEPQARNGGGNCDQI